MKPKKKNKVFVQILSTKELPNGEVQLDIEFSKEFQNLYAKIHKKKSKDVTAKELSDFFREELIKYAKKIKYNSEIK